MNLPRYNRTSRITWSIVLVIFWLAWCISVSACAHQGVHLEPFTQRVQHQRVVACEQSRLKSAAFCRAIVY